ncbi:hypothetical protein [Halorussus lipolyticus]|uniref:hypothetical protein n=1 Tax=Halorussus lipolyticus TaxID=3034024 RepID=UPI0023E75D34|nr:hypothetical protein [Halorussus sp. DT80]
MPRVPFSRDERATTAPAEDPTNKSSETDGFEVEAVLAPGETVSLDGVADEDAQYRFVVTVDDRESQSFERRGPDDYCQLVVAVASGGAVEVRMGCA